MAAGARWCGSKTKLGSDDEDDEEGGADQRSFCSALVPIKVGMGQPSRPVLRTCTLLMPAHPPD
eukprot:scaffold182927_cov19-Tisochrysis_lutea.AAC.4